MRFNWRKAVAVGPLRLRFSNGRFTGWGLQVGPWTWSARTGRHSIDTPGPGSIQLGGRKRRR